MLDLASAAHDPYDRCSYQPGHFTASGFVLHPDGRRVLLIHHAKVGKWLQPGGHVDPGDHSPLDCARREIAEETGVTGLHPIQERVFDIDIHRFPARGDDPAHDHYDLRYAFVAASETLSHNDEVVAARWMTRSDLVSVQVDRSIERPVVKLLGQRPIFGQRPKA